ncbi:hypothetical protein PoB_001775400 [Plakobranchus ocellatus]|uniref:Uncharacterized protein n=1 Tax=Plakobranchus ocellatus TaxID=259542 RepID=A0AAV3ZA55_9GAST|nr:hypothetical protein PoB_001775400 [Plakobranchus ocellatus]
MAVSYLFTYGLVYHLCIVNMETANAVTLPFRDTASTTPPVVFGRTPPTWRRTVALGRDNYGQDTVQDIRSVLERCPSYLPVFLSTCDVNLYTCSGRCGQILNDKPVSCERGSSSGKAVGYHPRRPRFDSQSGPNQIFIAAPLCLPSTKWVARSLRTRRNDQCPDELAEFQEKFGHFQAVSSVCTKDGYRIVDSCIPEIQLDTSNKSNENEDGQTDGSLADVPHNLDNTRSNLIVGDWILADNADGNSSHANASMEPLHGTEGQAKDADLNEGEETSNRTREEQSITTGLVVTDPSTGISYINQSILACNRLMALKLSRSTASASPSLYDTSAWASSVPIRWSRRLFVESKLEPEQVILFDNTELVDFVDSPPPSVSPRHCSSRFQLSCWKQIEPQSCWFLSLTNMATFCEHARAVYSSLLDNNGRANLSEIYQNLNFSEEDEEEMEDHFLPNYSPYDPYASPRENKTDLISISEFVGNSSNASCSVRNFKGGSRGMRNIFFSLTMNLNHESGVFVVANNEPDAVGWEKIHCKMANAEENALSDSDCDRVYCSFGFFFAPGFELNSACMKPTLLEISFIFRGIDSSILSQVLDLVQDASGHYGSDMVVTALGGFVDMKLGSMAYTDTYRIYNVSLSDESDLIPSTLALLKSLQRIELSERLRFPEWIQVCFVFSQITTEESSNEEIDALIVNREMVQNRCDKIHLHARSVTSVSLHVAGGAVQVRDNASMERGDFEGNGAMAVCGEGCPWLAGTFVLLVFLQLEIALKAF